MERASREAAVVPLQMAYRKYRRSCIVGPYHTLDSIAAALTNDDAAAPQICDALSPIGITRGRGHERKMHADVALLQRCWRGAATRFAFLKALPKLQEERRLRQLEFFFRLFSPPLVVQLQARWRGREVRRLYAKLCRRRHTELRWWLRRAASYR